MMPDLLPLASRATGGEIFLILFIMAGIVVLGLVGCVVFGIVYGFATTRPKDDPRARAAADAIHDKILDEWERENTRRGR